MVCEFVVALLWSGCTAGPVCSGAVGSCCSAFRRGPGGGGGGVGGAHMTGPCKAELVAPIVPRQTHHFGVLLSPRCQPSPQHDSEPDVPAPCWLSSFGFFTFQGWQTAEQVHMLPQGQSGRFCAPFSAKLRADITVYLPAAHAMFGSLTFA